MSTPAEAMGWHHPPFAAAEANTGWRHPFTASQWRELELQALIYKYLVVGVPVPTDLLLPIHQSFHSFDRHYPDQGYCSYYGKKLDPEPGRCRRTDGKKWRCSKEAHIESKYCERHMHRNRNRSRKPVESKSNSQSQRESHSSSSTVTSNVASGSRSFQNITLQSTLSGVSKTQGLCSSSSGSSLPQLDAKSYETGSKENRNLKYLDGAKVEMDEHNFFSESSRSCRDGFRMNSSSDSPLLGHSQHHLHAIQYLNEATINLPRQPEHPYSFFGSDYSSRNQGKQECQGLSHFFGWSKARHSWLNLEDEQSKQNSSTTQLSISIPLAPDLSGATSSSPSGD